MNRGKSPSLAEIKLAKLRQLRQLHEQKAERDRLAAANRPRRWATPGDMARDLDPRTVQTPALDLIDRALVDLADAPGQGRLAIFLPPQEGKALALDTPIATPSGWTTMGALAVGDQVFDRHGEPCRVTWVSPIWQDRPCYELLTGDGDSIVADADHEWPARLWRGSPEALYTTAQLAHIQSKNPQIVGPADLNLPDADLPLDPYVLGVWLGDGHSRGARLTCADSEIVDYVRASGWPCRKDASTRYGWSLCPEGFRGQGASPFRQVLVQLGVWGNKHIPVQYLRGSGKQRLALLQGLVDTDGYVSPKGQVEFCTIKESMARDVQHLVLSLGGKATVHEGRATIDGRDCGPKYRVRFYLADAARLTRKAARCRDASTARTRYVWSRQVASVPTRCIEVDSPTHTYLAGRSLLPTHNSERASHWFPLWALVDNPELRIAIVSHDAELARGWGSAIKDNIEQFNGDEGTIDLGLRLRDDSRAKGRWHVDGHRGGLYAVSIGGSLTGRAVDLLIIDDPISNLEQAQSPTYRERAHRFWQGVAVPRMGPQTKTILIQTRWHEDDLAGKLLATEGDKAKGGKWQVISIPAQCEDEATDPLGRKLGEYMISTRGRTRTDWDERKKDLGSYVWAALCQQRPAPAEGGLFKRLWWRYWTRFGDHLTLGPRTFRLADCWRFATVDLAASTRASADWTVISAWARTIAGDLVLLDRFRAHIDENSHFDAARPLVQRWQLDTLFVERSQYGMTLSREAANEGVPINPVDAESDKLSRALPASRWVERGRVWLPAGAPWLDEWIGEFAGFPNASHDDQVDTASYAVRVAITQPAPVLTPPAQPDPAEVDWEHIAL